MTIHPESPPLTPNWWILTSTGGGRSVGTSTSPVLQRSGTPVPAVTPATNRDVRDGQSEPLSLRTPPRPASPDEATTVTAERRGVLEPRAAEADTQMPSHAERRAKRSLRSWSPYLSKSSMHAAIRSNLVLFGTGFQPKNLLVKKEQEYWCLVLSTPCSDPSFPAFIRKKGATYCIYSSKIFTKGPHMEVGPLKKNGARTCRPMPDIAAGKMS